MNKIKLATFFLMILMIVSCNFQKTYGENELITSKEDQEYYLIGKWDIIGNMKSEDGIYMNIEGEMEFRDPKRFEGIIGITIKLSDNDKKIVTIACNGEGIWKWLENGGSDIDKASSNNCNCTYKSHHDRISDRDLDRLKDEFSLCKNGEFYFGGGDNEDDDSSFSSTNIEFRKNKIDLEFKDFGEGESMKISVIRKGDLK